MTDPASASENAIVLGGTTLVLLWSFLGWQNTTAAPKQVDSPAIVDKYSGSHGSCGGSDVVDMTMEGDVIYDG